MRAIILSAGIGKRLGNLTRDMPKCLLKLRDISILEEQVIVLKRCGIGAISVVAGEEGDCWSRENHIKIKSICNHVAFNEANVSKGRVYSLFKGIKDVEEGPALIIDGDVFFDKIVINRILEFDKENAMLSEVIPSDCEKRKIIAGSAGRIVHFGVKEPVDSKAYFYGGIMKVGKELFKDMRRIVLQSENHNKNLSVIIDELCKHHSIYTFTLDGRWVNINTIEDINKAKKLAEKKNVAVIFDLDGVIFDSEPLQLKAYKDAFIKQGIKMHDEDYSINSGRKDIFQRICKRHNKICDLDKWYKDKNDIYWKEIDKGIEMLPGVEGLIKELYQEGYRMVLVSSTSRRNLLFILNKLKARDYFEELIGFEDTKKGKPNPEPYLKAAEKLDIDPKKCIVIEDTSVGVEAAKRAGMKCVAVTQTNRVKQDNKKADIVLKSLENLTVEELVAIVEK